MLSRYSHFVLWLAILFSYQAAEAQVTAPSQGGEVSLIRVTATTMELRFGMTGTGQGRIVVMAAAPTGTPGPMRVVDNIFYSADSSYGLGTPIGQGYVVYFGSGHSATITGLIPSTYYYVATAEFNRDSSSIAYNTRSSNMATSTRAGVATALATQSSTTRDVEVYPNPSTGQAVQLILRGYGNETCSLSLTDALGHLVSTQKLIAVGATTAAPLTLPGSLAAGTYLLTLAVGSEAPLHKHLVIMN